MIRRPSPYANVSLAPPETIQANFGVPEPMNVPQMQPPPDTGGQIADLGQTLMGLKKQRFSGAQGDSIANALKGAKLAAG
jgi:hypothetical protein